MPQITETLTARKFELIRDRIGEILADELPNQATLNSNPALSPTIYVERLIPVSQEETPVVNVVAAESDFNRHTQLTQTGENRFIIDVFESGPTEGSAADQRGDTISSKKTSRLAGLIQAILSHFKYCQLGFGNGFVDRVEVESIKFLEPIKAEDGANLTKARLIVLVKAEESVAPVEPRVLDGYDTAVKLHLTEMGYVFSGDQPPIIPPICTFDVVIYGSFAAGNNSMVPFNVDSDSAGTYTEIYADGDSGTIAVSVNGSPFAPFAPPLELADGDVLNVERSGFAVDGWYKLKGGY